MSRPSALLYTVLATAVLAVAAITAPATADSTVATGSEPTATESSYPTAHGRVPMTIYRPPNPQRDAPAVVMVHGGAWTSGSRTLLDGPARQAAAAGLVVFDIDYDLDTPRFPRERDDVIAAIDHVHSHAAEFGIDPDRIGGLGTSAGANLLMLAVTSGKAPLHAVVGWSGPYNLTAHDGLRNQALALTVAPRYLGCTPSTPRCNTLAEQASPTHNVTAAVAPTLLFNSESEPVDLDQMTGFATRLRAVGTSVETRIIPGHRHAVQYADDATAPTIAFLLQHL